MTWFALNSHWADWSERAAARAADGWIDMVEQLRALQDIVAGSVPPAGPVAEVTSLIARACELLEPHKVVEDDEIFGRLLQLPNRGQTFSPPIWVTEREHDELSGTTQFGPFHSGHGGAVHGGAVALMFDDALGMAADLGGRLRSRTAFLKVDYRSITPLGRPLALRAWVTEEVGRKRYLRGTLHDGERLCAEATALYVELLAGQQ